MRCGVVADDCCKSFHWIVEPKGAPILFLRAARRLACLPTRKGSLKKQVKKTIVEITVLIIVILSFALAARLVGEDTSMLPWNW